MTQLQHVGHVCEVAYKIPSIRKQFPGTIDFLASTHGGNLNKWTEDLLKIGFGDEDWKASSEPPYLTFQVPPYFSIYLLPTHPLCFQELLGIIIHPDLN